MAIKKISDFASGNILQPVDKVLVARGATNVFVTGAAVPSTQDFNPAFASMFPNGSWGGGAVSPAIGIDNPRGLQFGSPGLERGFRLMTRPIPEAQRADFWFVARVSYAGIRSISGAGIAVSTGQTGTAPQVVSLYRHLGYYGDVHSADAAYYNGSTEVGLTSTPANYRWMRIEVRGSVVSMFGSEDGFFWNPCGSQDVGAPVTEYGFFYRCDTDFAPVNEVALCDYFDSTELAADPLVRQAGRVVSKVVGIDAPHQYWRLNVSRNWGSTLLGIGWVVMRSTVGGKDRCVGGTPLDGGYTDSNPANLSFQGGPVTPSYPGWVSNRISGYVGYRFPFPVLVREVGYQRAKAGGYDASPRDLTLEYSDDGVTWTVANTYTDLPVAEYGQFNTVLVNPKDAVTTKPNAAATSVGLSRTGCRAAYSTRRLFDAYNGPLFAVQTATNNVDIFAGADGQADLTALTAVAGSSYAVVTSWYDQSGHGLHASPIASIDALSVGAMSNRPVVVVAGAPVLVGGRLALAIDAGPLDIVGANFLGGSNIVVRGSFKKQGGASPVLSMLTTNVSALNIGFTDNATPIAANLDQTISTGTVAFTDDAPMTLVASVKMTNSIATVQTGYGLTLDGVAQTLSFGSAQPAPFARIGAAAWKNTLGEQFGYNVLYGAKITEILVYDSSVDITADFTKSS